MNQDRLEALALEVEQKDLEIKKLSAQVGNLELQNAEYSQIVKELSDRLRMKADEIKQLKEEMELADFDKFINEALFDTENLAIDVFGDDKTKSKEESKQEIASALEQGSISALEKEKTTEGNKTEMKQLKEAKIQSKILKKIEDKLESTETVNI